MEPAAHVLAVMLADAQDKVVLRQWRVESGLECGEDSGLLTVPWLVHDPQCVAVQGAGGSALASISAKGGEDVGHDLHLVSGG